MLLQTLRVVSVGHDAGIRARADGRTRIPNTTTLAPMSHRTSARRTRRRRRRRGCGCLRGGGGSRGSEAEELHILRALNGYAMADTYCVDALQRGTIGVPSIRCERGVGLRVRRFRVVVAEDAGPFLDGLVPVVGVEGGVCAAVVDLHLRSRARVAWVHVLDDVGPLLRCIVGETLCAGAVPCVHGVGLRYEAAGWYAGVDDTGFEQVRIGGC